ncbi:FecR/PupR family sigma factor regulator [Biformimicrobium ophioploci]|uniref:FecR N-terminal domain-containing protein n=1 Tax=Biformimicrobium ophioploci TaxID=3036711 RepID=A0ABQ6LXG2_9GAMM|nr:DUF4880 domain-containing protein [Microbulbifer sp. NKW57]GMG86764.1 hypothetical protein MNKW57_10850 [Microbulbifer sp. NKW57]
MSLDEWICYGIPEETQAEASGWIARLDGDDVSAEMRSRFSLWLDADPTNRWAYEELSLVWARVATLSDRRAQIHESKVLIFPTPDTAPVQKVSKHSWWQSAAAILLIVAGFSFAWLSPVPVIESGSTENTQADHFLFGFE